MNDMASAELSKIHLLLTIRNLELIDLDQFIVLYKGIKGW